MGTITLLNSLVLYFLVTLCSLVISARASDDIQPSEMLENNLAKLPPMGWLNWERFTCELDCERHPKDCISSRLFKEQADRIVEDGYLRAGYKYVNIDDCWSNLEREAGSGRLEANSSRFPEGLSELAEHLHKLGLKMGIYGDCGETTCAGYPGLIKPNTTEPEKHNYFKTDAEQMVRWGVDSYKMDGCYIDPRAADAVCPAMSKALLKAGRPVLLICEWTFYEMYAHKESNLELAAESCNVMRYYDDVDDSWLSILNIIDHTVKHQSKLIRYHGPGHWFDPDQLVIGNFGLSIEQQRAQMAIWCLWSAPLYMSNDLRDISEQSKNLLQNEHLIRINQDPLGIMGLMVRQSQDGQLQAFVKSILPIRQKCPSFAGVYLNRNTLGNRVQVSFKLRDLLTKAPIIEVARRTRQQQLGSLNAIECLDILKHSQTLSFRVYDLIDGRKPLDTVHIDEELSLLVSPSGVRAFELEILNVDA